MKQTTIYPGKFVRFSIATWNINSVRLRLALVARYLSQQRPDVLCLQETKCPDGQFPTSEFKALGYEHVAINGQKGYHGVAVLSRHRIEGELRRDFCGKSDCRHIAVALSGPSEGIEIHNFYVPAGGDEPDPATNEKFAHKLAFVDEMREWFLADPPAGRRVVLVGDLNIAPLEHDVWNHRALLNVVSHTPIEVAKLNSAQAAGEWRDAMRKFVPASKKLYTWWSYRSPDWMAADKGRRLDHVWVSPPLADAVTAVTVHKEARSWERPSDHAPVKVDFEF